MATPAATDAGDSLGVAENGRDAGEVVAGVRGAADDLVGASMKLADVLDSAFIFLTCIGQFVDDMEAIAGAGSPPFSAALVDGVSFLTRSWMTPENGCTSGTERPGDSVVGGSF